MARETNADSLVMGAKPSTSLAGHAPFAVACHVVTKAHCPRFSN